MQYRYAQLLRSDADSLAGNSPSSEFAIRAISRLIIAGLACISAVQTPAAARAVLRWIFNEYMYFEGLSAFVPKDPSLLTSDLYGLLKLERSEFRWEAYGLRYCRIIRTVRVS